MSKGHRITITPSDERVEVRVGGHLVAESDRPVVLRETGLPPRYYLRREDVRTDLLRPSSKESVCPFKGSASYWSVEVEGERYDDVVWSYENPIAEAEGIRELLSFYNERVDLRVGAASPSGSGDTA